MDEGILYFGPDDYEIINLDDYQTKPTKFIGKLPKIGKSLLSKANDNFLKVEKLLYAAPSFINAIKASIPEETLQAVLSNDQRQAIAKGALKLMTKKDGSLMATLVNTKTGKIAATVPLKSVNLAPEITQAATNYATQLQMAQIAEKIENVQLAIEDVRKGQESDRLAIAYSCQQKLLQAREIVNPQLRTSMLLQVISDAEDSRNLLMLSQKANIAFIKKQPEDTFGKFIKGVKQEKIDSKINEIRDGLSAVNIVSLSAAIAYTELGEEKAAQKSLEYFGDFLTQTYLTTSELLNRLDMLDPSPTSYWSTELPQIKTSILELPNNIKEIETEDL
ncbi:hypothetical protein [Streptococcus loxodontisalivarius]|uniref:Uncharacterized protein n=1 Tax=Streptococcus loxodontisalivarius TaxID=1349415 RepID=A0ABS2PTR6_9STRE|nr:hypothetical protein [Streptococcus loxodontisalivarius]MBM7643400.1 hypothetical protein [Streptococcus loxodontisalivarius]